MTGVGVALALIVIGDLLTGPVCHHFGSDEHTPTAEMLRTTERLVAGILLAWLIGSWATA